MEDTRKKLENIIKDFKGNSFSIPIDVNKIQTNNDSSNLKDNYKDVVDIISNFKMKPKQVKEYLDRFVIQQNDAKIALSVAICDHYNHIKRQINKNNDSYEYLKQNILLIGPTGVGKTYLIKCLANLIGVPFVKADATKYSSTGYVGGNVEDLVRDLVKFANGNVELAEYGIIYIDEIDKIACDNSSASNGNKDVSGRGVQTNLLKLMEDYEVSLISQTDMIGQFESVINLTKGKTSGRKTINTKNILFIVSGSFVNLENIIKERVGYYNEIGFNKSLNKIKSDINFLNNNSTADFIKYGFEPEFIGRLPIRIVCNELSSNDLELILKNSEGSILKQYIDDFNSYGIDIKITDDAISEIANLAYMQKTGARGLMTVMEKLFRNSKYELPSTEVVNFTIDNNFIKTPEKSLKLIIKNSKKDNKIDKGIDKEIDKFTEDFFNHYGFLLSFTNKAKKLIETESKKAKKSIYDICYNKFNDYSFGLNLIVDHLKNKKLTINDKMIKSPKDELSKFISSIKNDS